MICSPHLNKHLNAIIFLLTPYIFKWIKHSFYTLCSIFGWKMTSPAVFLKDASLQLEASFEVDFCMLECEYYWLNKM